MRPSSVRIHRACLVLATLFAAVGLLAGHISAAPPAAAASVSDLTPHEARLVELINQARAQNGLGGLGVAGGAVDVARNWAYTMAGSGYFGHNPNYVSQLQASGSGNATRFAENVAYGYPSADAMFTAYMNSAGHRANILSPYMVYVGIGSVRSSNGQIYNTMNFVNAELGTYGPPRIGGDHFGGATDRLLLLRNSATPGGNDIPAFTYGSPYNTTLSCDVSGDGRDDLITYNGGVWDIRSEVGPGRPYLSFSYGWPGATPVCGNWDGAGGAGIGIYAGGTWYLRNNAGPGYADAIFSYGGPSHLPVVGDWNGDGVDSIGVVDSGSYTWLVKNANSPGYWDAAWSYGFRGAIPSPGNYAGSRTTELGVYWNGIWYVRDVLGPGPARTFSYGGPDYLPLVGDWNADGRDGIGVTRPS